MPISLSRIFPSDVAYIGQKHQYSKDFDMFDASSYKGEYNLGDDIITLCEFNRQASGVQFLELRAPIELTLMRISDQIGRNIISSQESETPIRIGIIGVHNVGKSTIAKSLFGSDMKLYQTLTNKINGKEDKPFRVVEGCGRDFGKCVLIDAFEAFPEDHPKVFQDNQGYAEFRRSFAEIESMNSADIVVMEHPNTADEWAGKDKLEEMRENKGFDLLIFAYQMKNSEERHVTLVTPIEGLLSHALEDFGKLMKKDFSSLVRGELTHLNNP